MQQMKRIAMWIIIAQFLTAFVGRSISPLMFYISADLSLNKGQLGFLPTALFIGQFIATLLVGYLADRLSTRKIMVCLMIIVGTGFLSFAWIDNYTLALVFVVLAGMGYGGMHPVTNRFLMNILPVNQVSLLMGLKQMSITLGSAGSSVVLIPLVAYIGWRYTLSVAAVVLLMFSFIMPFVLKTKEDSQTEIATKLPLRQQLRIFLHSKWLFFTNSSAFILMGIQMTFNTYIILFLYEIKDWPIYSAGICLAIAEISGASGRVLWGIISDKFFNKNRWAVLLIITILSANGIILMYFTYSTFFIVMCIAIIGFSLAGFNGIWMTLAVESVEKSMSGFASGFSIMVASIGVFLIPPVFGSLVEYWGYLVGGIFLISLFACCAIFMVIALLTVKKVQPS
ncbi:MFS transporter [Lysinibacillus sp. FSL W7-1291]|uniref:MFS transporter n=1 Tax=Lysinibacillus sp. FSL W7-1291 TaxID=2954544 RepID=UPI003159F5D0